MMEKQFLKFLYVKSLNIGSVTARRGAKGNFLVGTIQFNGAYYSCAIFPDSRKPGQMNITVELPMYDTYSYKRDQQAARETEETQGAEIAGKQLDEETVETVDPEGIKDAPEMEVVEDLFK